MKSVLPIFSLVIIGIHMINSCPTVCPCKDDKIYCSGQHMYNIPRGTPRRTKLLDFRNNRLPMITIAMMKKFDNLRTLLVGSNGLAYIQPGALHGLRRMKYIDFGQNQLQNLSQDSFASMEKVLTILLSDNRLVEIENMFSQNERLQTLSLKNNRIMTISDKTFMNNKKLKFIDLSRNQITFIAKNAFVKMIRLKYLFLGYNPLKSLRRLNIPSRGLVMAEFTNCSLQSMIKGLPKPLRDLRYELNFIVSVSADDLRNTTQLGFLTLSWNNITDIEHMIWSKFKYIYNLYLDNNLLTYIPRRLPPNTRTLFLQKNKITELPGHVFKSLKHLETMELQNNQISKIHGAAFKGLTTLRNLKLSDNKLNWLKKNVFRDLVNLDALDLSRNPIARIDGNALHGLRKMIILQMSQIPYVTSMGRHIFAKAKNLQFLDVSSSPQIGKMIAHREVKFGYLHKVEDLNLMNNGLHKLRRDFPYHLPALRMIKLSHNPWTCDRPMKWMHNWLKNRTVEFFHIHDIRCESPQQLKRRPVQDVRSWEFKNAKRIPLKPTTYDERDNSVIPLEVNINLERMFNISMEGETFQTLPTHEEIKLTEHSGNNEG